MIVSQGGQSHLEKKKKKKKKKKKGEKGIKLDCMTIRVDPLGTIGSQLRLFPTYPCFMFHQPFTQNRLEEEYGKEKKKKKKKKPPTSVTMRAGEWKSDLAFVARVTFSCAPRSPTPPLPPPPPPPFPWPPRWPSG